MLDADGMSSVSMRFRSYSDYLIDRELETFKAYVTWLPTTIVGGRRMTKFDGNGWMEKVWTAVTREKITTDEYNTILFFPFFLRLEVFHCIDNALLLQWRLCVFRLFFSGAIEFSSSKNVYDHWKGVTTIAIRSRLRSVLWKNCFYFYTFNSRRFFTVFLFSIMQP